MQTLPKLRLFSMVCWTSQVKMPPSGVWQKCLWKKCMHLGICFKTSGRFLQHQKHTYPKWISTRLPSPRLPNTILPSPFCRISYCWLLLKMTKFHNIIFYLKKNIDDVYIIFRAILIRKTIIKCILIDE